MISAQFSHTVMSKSLQLGLQHSRLPCPSLSPEVCSNSGPLSWWCHPTISSSVIPFSSCLQSFPASGSFPMNWLFASGGQRIRASASVLPMNIQDWFPSGLTSLILLSKGFWRVFSSTTVWKHQFFGTQPSLHFPGGSVGKESACNEGYPGSVPGWGGSPGEGNGHPLQYSCLENSMDRRTWWVTESQTWLSD